MSDSQQSIPKRKESNSDNDRSDDWEKSPTVYSVKRQRMRQGKNVEISPRTDLVSFAKQNNTLTRESKDIVQITPTEREPWSVKRSRGSLQVKVHQIQQNYLQKINQESNCFPEPVNDNYSNQDLFITNDQTKGEQFISKKWKQASQLDNQSDDSMFGPDFKLEDLEALDLFEKELGIAPQQNPAQNQENKDVDNGSNGNNKNQNLNYDNDNDNDNDNDDYMFGDDFPLEDVENLLFDLEEGVHKEPTSAATGTGGSGVAFSVPFEKIEPIFKVPEPSGLSSDRLSIINNSQSIQVSNSQPSQESKNLSVQGDSNQKKTKVKLINTIKRRYRRCVILNIISQEFNTPEVNGLPEKVLVLMDNDENVPVHVHVREDWLMTPLCIGDIIHIPLPGQERPLRMIVDNENNFIITCPDKLLSITAVAGSYLCLRKSVLQQKTSGPSEYSQPLVHGDIMHQVFQYALKTSDFSESTLRTELLRVIRSSLIPLLAIGQDEEEAFVIMKDYIDTIRAFGDIYIGLYPKRNATLADNTNTSRTKSKLDIDTLSISRILDIEENLWSPTYGIKGMLDATIEIKTSPNKKTLIVPFELKTGKPTKSIAHCAQTILYTLLMSDRYDTSIDVGALLYSRSNSFFILPASRNEMKSLIMARNNLALALSNQETLPPMIKSLHTCQMCNMSNTCLAFHKAVEGGDSASSGLSKWFDLKTEQIRPEDAAFFRHWQSLIDLEEENVDNLRKDIWTQPGELRELEGKCLNNMKMSKPLQNDDENFTRSFYRDPAFESKNNVKPLSHSQIGKGDPVIISSTSGHVNLGMGSVLFISANLIRIQLTRPMRRVPKKGEGFDDDFNQVYERPKSEDGATYNTYRIDIDNVSIGMGTLRHNIVALVSKDEDGGDEKRKRLIVDLETPNFVNNDLEHISNTTELNTDQQAAVMKVLSAKDYALILGMPGTGKTTTMAHIIKELIMQNKSVLVAAYTHTALDNVLLKVRESGIDVLRIGNPLKIMPELRSCVAENNPALDSIQAIKDFYKSKKVVGTTCLGIKDVFFHNRKFDYCIIDEASQITLPVCIGPLRFAETFVLVGDRYQLAPVIRNEHAKSGGLEKSLFDLLAEAHPQSVVYLKYQYRMNKDIMKLCNTLIYDNKLKCGNNQVAMSSLEIPQLNKNLEEIHKSQSEKASIHMLCSGVSCWLKDILDPSRKIVFVDTDALEGVEERPQKDQMQNPTELKIIQQIIYTMLMCGIKPDQLGIISVYRSQVRAAAQYFGDIESLETSTIDKYQGRDKDCIIISLVRKNPRKQVGDLLRDWKRVNVAVTRAKKKLILVGSVSTLESSILFKHLLMMLRTNNWIYKFPPGGEVNHIVDSTPQSPKAEKTKGPKTFTSSMFLKNKNILTDIFNELS